MFQFPKRSSWIVLALALVPVTSRDIRGESTLMVSNSNRDEEGAITFFVKASSKSWNQATRLEISPQQSRRLRLVSDDSFNIAVRDAEGVIFTVETVQKWDATKDDFVGFGKHKVDLHQILSRRRRGDQHYHLNFIGIGKGRSPSDFTPDEKVAPGGQIGSIKVTRRAATLTFPAVFGSGGE